MQENIKNQLIYNPLGYRGILTIPKNINFGLEIELDSVDYDKVYHLVRKQFGTSFEVKTDRSLMIGRNAEIALPVLRNEKNTWILLKKLAILLSKLNPTFENCSFQINFDGSLLPTMDDRIQLLKLYAYYEDIINKFSQGEDNKYRYTLNIYAAPLILCLKDTLCMGEEDKDLILERFSNNKRYGLVFKTDDKDLIEFRTPNGTINPVLWQNYITFFYYFLLFVKSGKYNTQDIDAYIGHYSKLDILDSYEIVREDKAISLSKKMFNNQRDRVYFLHQYLREKL